MKLLEQRERGRKEEKRGGEKGKREWDAVEVETSL